MLLHFHFGAIGKAHEKLIVTHALHATDAAIEPAAVFAGIVLREHHLRAHF